MNLFILFNFANKMFRWQAVGATIKNKSGLICRLCKLAVYAKDLDTKVHQTPPVVKSSYTRFIHGHRGNFSLKSLLLKLLRQDMERYPNRFTGFNPSYFISSLTVSTETPGDDKIWEEPPGLECGNISC